MLKIYVANLKAYNEGILKGEWFELPVDIDEVYETIFDEDELDENGTPKHDWAIHDYEAPFRISEYESIEKLNSIAELIEFAAFAQSINMDDYVEHIVDNEDVDAIVENSDRGWQGIKCMLANATIGNDYYKIDGYKNIVDLTSDDLVFIVRDIFNNL